MINTDEEALICDLAETYHIYDYRQLPPQKVAVFALGLRDDSRIKMKISGQVAPIERLLLAGISDRLSTLVWFQTEDGQKGKNRPTMLADLLTNNNAKSEKEVITFDSGEDFIKVRNRLLEVNK